MTTIHNSMNLSHARTAHTFAFGPVAAELENAVEQEPYIKIPIENELESDSKEYTPKKVVQQLDRHIVGQNDAKRAVAIALRNRWRRHKLTDALKSEVMPKNILMVGPTGTGKTEIARRLAKLANAPFIKVEATKFTEIGFHGRDVDLIIRDLVDIAINMVKAETRKKHKVVLDQLVEERILDALLQKSIELSTREDFRRHLRSGLLESQKITIEVPVKETEIDRGLGPKQAFNDVLVPSGQSRGQSKRFEQKSLTIADSRAILEELESERQFSNEDIVKQAVDAVEQGGVVFIDEIDKICTPSNARIGADASAEGVQRDLLPIIEGSIVSTKYGNVKTDHILFIASGAFHVVKVTDMLAELQGRLPIRVVLKALTESDLYRVLTEPDFNLIKQQIALMATEDVKLVVEDAAIREIARIAAEVNRTIENTGARRLHTIIEKIMEDISFDAAEQPPNTVITVTKEMVIQKVGDIMKKSDLSKFVL
jgi:ATP-dependent HslUV protease ATP-binding subunit HslU